MALSSSGNRVPDYRREINDLQAEIRKLWQALGRQQSGPPVQKEIVFSWAGGVSGTTAATLLINGASVTTFNLYAGMGRGGTQSRHAVSTGDRVQLSVAGGGGSDLVATLSYVTDTGL